MGAGTIHHVAWATEGGLPAWRQRVIGMGCLATPVIDRAGGRSIYFREPSGVLFEIAAPADARGEMSADDAPRAPPDLAAGRSQGPRRRPRLAPAGASNLRGDRGGSDSRGGLIEALARWQSQPKLPDG